MDFFMEPITLTALLVGKYVLTHLGITAATTSTATAVGGATIAAATVATIVVVTLSLSTMINWFHSKRHKVDNHRYVNRSVQDRLSNGDYATQYGVFDTHKDQFIDSVYTRSSSIDSALASKHAGRRTVTHYV